MANGNESNGWPGGPEPNRGRGGNADPRSSAARAGQPPWDQPPQPWDQPVQPPRGGSDPARARGPQRPDPQRPDPRQADPRYADPRYADPRQADPRYADPRQADPRYADPRQADPRYADPRQADPRNSAAGAQNQEQRARNPRRDPGQRGWMADGGPDDQDRQFRGDAPEAPYPEAPGGRHRTGSPGASPGQAGPGGGRGPGRTITLVGGGVLVAIMLVGAALGLSRGSGGSPASAPTEDPSAAAQSGPGTPAVTARSLGGQQVEFSWSYANPASGDTFRVRSNGAQPTTVDKPDIVLSVAQGSKECIQVQVVSANGTASAVSNQACSPS
jgi:hypothetical protein